jgi:Flp pilus assembly pilin Flp
MKRDVLKGQSILEYALVLGVVIAVVVAVLLGGQNSMKDKIENIYDKAGDALANTTTDLTGGVFQ